MVDWTSAAPTEQYKTVLLKIRRFISCAFQRQQFIRTNRWVEGEGRWQGLKSEGTRSLFEVVSSLWAPTFQRLLLLKSQWHEIIHIWEAKYENWHQRVEWMLSGGRWKYSFLVFWHQNSDLEENTNDAVQEFTAKVLRWKVVTCCSYNSRKVTDMSCRWKEAVKQWWSQWRCRQVNW